ncbi:hypothetical protein J2X13_002693 [Aminobacter aminovorans]|nr:hypothetical protein [Aminobacter aminovorans]
MDRNTGIYAMTVAVAFAVATLLAIGLTDRARDPGPIQEAAPHTLN